MLTFVVDSSLELWRELTKDVVVDGQEGCCITHTHSEENHNNVYS